MIIRNAKIFLHGRFTEGSVAFRDVITGICCADSDPTGNSENDREQTEAASGEKDDLMDARGGYLIPGLIDVHTHGGMNADASDGDPAGMFALGEYYLSQGVTGWCPTTMTLREPELTKAMACIAAYARAPRGARVLGIHMEGPFVAKEKCGAQNPANLSLPDVDLFRRLQDASGGLIKLITLAPELPGAMDFIREISDECAISLGHTIADFDTASSAFSSGANHVTHLYNAMPPLAHREPGVIGAAVDRGAFAELITDGFHIHPAVVRMTAELFKDRLILISDSLRCAGMPDGSYELGGQTISMQEGKAFLEGTTTIAGSSIHLMEGLRRAVRFGIPLEKAVTAATFTPARSIGVDDTVGSIEIGKLADLVLLDSSLRVRAVFLGGELVSL